MTLRRLDNIDVLCVDLDQMVPFYRDVIGLPFVLPYVRSEGWAGFQAGDVTIFLIEIGGAAPLRRVPGAGPAGTRVVRVRRRRPRGEPSPSSTRTA